MANQKITQLTETTTPETNDLLAITISPDEATPLSRSVSLLNLVGTGWVKSNDTWAYASATTITVPSGAVAIYSVGDKIKLTQTTAKYFYVTSVADTVLTVTGGSDYTVANEAITSPYYSKAASPVGFPSFFNCTAPTMTTSGTAFTNQPTTKEIRFKMTGTLVTVNGKFTNHATSGGTGRFIVTCTAGELPPSYIASPGSAFNQSTGIPGLSWVTATDNVITLCKYDGTVIATDSQVYNLTCSYLCG